jgi:hypothetical protein
MVSDNGAISVCEGNYKVPFVTGSSHGVEEMGIFISQFDPSNCVSLFPLGSFGFLEHC